MNFRCADEDCAERRVVANQFKVRVLNVPCQDANSNAEAEVRGQAGGSRTSDMTAGRPPSAPNAATANHPRPTIQLISRPPMVAFCAVTTGQLVPRY